jgi:hypothetical protein
MAPAIKRSGSRSRRLQCPIARSAADPGAKKIGISRLSTGFAPIIDRFSTARTMTPSRAMLRRLLLIVTMLAVGIPSPAHAASATLFRIFLLDGTDLASYGEYARVGDEVVFSMPVGGAPDQPRLHLVTLAADKIDWVRTERYRDTARAAQYAETRGEDDFLQLSNEVARVLNDIALSPDRVRALALAQQARDVLAAWPQTHFRYKEAEVREILAIVEAAIAQLRGQPATGFELALVAPTVQEIREPLLAPPSPRAQIDRLLIIAPLAQRAADRVALLQAALALLTEHEAALVPTEATSLRATIEGQLRREADVDRRYSQLSQQLLANARKAAASARASEVERVLARITTDDARLGHQRPETIDALRAAVRERLDAARQLRLLRDQWLVRRAAYQEYQSKVATQMLQLVKARPQLEAIRKLEGPAPDRLFTVKGRLSGGAARLERMKVPPELQPAHDLLVSASRFAENAINGRNAAITSGDMSTAWTASSSAAGALMLLSRAQDEIRILLEIPRVQ